MITYIKSDLYRYYGKTSFSCFLRAMIENKGFSYLFFLRCVQHGRIMKYIALPVYWVRRNWGSINIGRKCQIGYGLYIGHGGPVVINDTAVIGNNVNLSQCVTIGSNKGKAARIEDNVYIGPNCCIVEDVRIGQNATIGAGTIVVKDIPENAVAVGNPAKVVRYCEGPMFIGNPWKI